MPTDQPNAAATQDLPADARDDTSAAAVLTDEQLDDAPGGGGLGGAAAADPLAGSGKASGGTAPNSPVDVPVPASTLDDTGQNPSAEQAVRAEAAADDSPPAVGGADR